MPAKKAPPPLAPDAIMDDLTYRERMENLAKYNVHTEQLRNEPPPKRRLVTEADTSSDPQE